MREIKFRGKRLDNDIQTGPADGWVTGFYYQDLCEGEVRHFIASCPCVWEVDPATVGQYTELKDKNGKEIWEGDIFRDNNEVLRSVFRVTGGLAFEDNPVSFGYDHRAPVYPYSPIAEMQNVSWLSQCCEVIGNIHDNPELLKRGE
jgi:hypothetical protein